MLTIWKFQVYLDMLWIETQPPIKQESVSVLQVDTDEEYAKILQRKYDNEGGILFGDQQM